MNPRPRDEEWWTRFWGGVRRRNTKLNKTQSDLTWCNPISSIPLFNLLLLLWVREREIYYVWCVWCGVNVCWLHSIIKGKHLLASQFH
jgi:hypothetical protein